MLNDLDAVEAYYILVFPLTYIQIVNVYVKNDIV